MYLTKTRKSPFYQMIYEVDGRRTSISTKTKYKAEAQKFMTEFYRQLLEGKVLKNSILLSKFKVDYEIYISISKSKKYYKSVVLSMNQLLKYFGDIPMPELTNKKLEEFILTTHSRAKSAAHLYFRTLKAAFSKAVDWEYLVENPFKKIKPPKQIKNLPITLLKKDFDLILKNTPQVLFRNFFITALYTGMRLSELINMKYSWINYQDFLITVKNDSSFTSKSKRERIIPINAKVFTALVTAKVNENEFVFHKYPGVPFSSDYISKRFKKAVRLSNLSDSIHFHTLRHTFASMLARKGVSLMVIKELMGHEDIKTTLIYSHLQTQDLTEAIEKL